MSDYLETRADPVSEAENREGNTLCIFQFKGGSAKTTMCVNLAGSFAASGEKVLLIDYDQQCNTTQFFNDSEWKAIDTSSQEKEKENDASAAGLREPGNVHPMISNEDKICPDGKPTHISAYVNADANKKNINKPFAAIFTQVSVDHCLEYLKHDESGQPHEESGIRRVNIDAFAGEDEPKQDDPKFQGHRSKGELWIFPGSEKLVEHEAEMGRQIQDVVNHNTTSKATLYAGICSAMLGELKKHYDMIIVDMSPSSGALNQAMAMSCEYIMPPVFGSVFSTCSIHSLFTSVLPRWYAWREDAVKAQLKSEDINDKFKFKPSFPKILPAVVSNYELLLEQENSKWVVGLIESNFVQTLHDFLNELRSDENPYTPERLYDQEGMRLMLENFSPRSDNQMVTCLVSHQPLIISVSEELGRTISELSLALYKQEYSVGTQAEAERKNWARMRGRQAIEVIMTEEALADFEMKLKYMQDHYKDLALWLQSTMTQKTQEKILQAKRSAFGQRKRKHGDTE